MPDGLRVALRRTALVGGTLLVMLLFGVSWWVASGLTVDVPRETGFERGRSFEPNNRVVAVDGREITLRADRATSLPGSRWGLQSERGYLRMVQQLALDEEAGSARWLVEGPGSRIPPRGLAVAVDPYVHVGNPRQALGLPFEQVIVDGPLGDQPVWHVPATTERRGTVVFVHSPGALNDEVNRFLPGLVEAGWDVLVPTYRGDPGAPELPAGRVLLGTQEWQDLAPVLDLAPTDQPLVLFGLSGGADIVMQLLDRADGAERVDGVVLDSPTLSLDARLADDLADRGVPAIARPLVSAAAQQIADVVHGLDSGSLEQVADDTTVARPTLVIVGEQDMHTDPALARDLAAVAPSVEVVAFPQAWHAVAWNTDPQRYVDVLQQFLGQVAS